VLNDVDGHPVRLGDLWSERPAVLVFLRHFGCVFCRQLAVDIHSHRHEFDEADVQLVVIGFGTPEQGRGFLKTQNVDLKLLLDPDRKVYELAGAKVATLNEVIGPLQVWRGLKATIMSRMRQGSIAVHQGRIVGHAAQLGGRARDRAGRVGALRVFVGGVGRQPARTRGPCRRTRDTAALQLGLGRLVPAARASRIGARVEQRTAAGAPDQVHDPG